jgi:hypothetical protein
MKDNNFNEIYNNVHNFSSKALPIMQKKLLVMDRLESFLKPLSLKLEKQWLSKRFSKTNAIKIESFKFWVNYTIPTVLRCANRFIPAEIKKTKFI